MGQINKEVAAVESLVGGAKRKQTGSRHARQRCLSSPGFDSSPARLSENRRRGRDEASPPILMCALMTQTHFLMRPTCPNEVLPAGLVCSVVKKGLNDPQRGGGSQGPAAFVCRGRILHLLLVCRPLLLTICDFPERSRVQALIFYSGKKIAGFRINTSRLPSLCPKKFKQHMLLGSGKPPATVLCKFLSSAL